MPAIGKFRAALRSMGTTVADFIEQRPHRATSQGNLGRIFLNCVGKSMVVEKKGRRLTLLIAGAGLLANELARRESLDLT